MLWVKTTASFQTSCGVMPLMWHSFATFLTREFCLHKEFSSWNTSGKRNCFYVVNRNAFLNIKERKKSAS